MIKSEKRTAASAEQKLASAIATELERRFLPRLARHMMIAARVAAADTLRTTERTETIFNRAIREGERAAEIAGE